MTIGIRTYCFSAWAIYWCATFHDGTGIIHRPSLRLALGLLFGVLAFISAAVDEMNDNKRRRMRWDD